MDANDRTNRLFDKAKRVGMTDAVTGDGRPSRSMVAEAISDAEFDAGQCGEIFLRELDNRMEYHRRGKGGNPPELDNAVMLALLNVRSAYQEAFHSENRVLEGTANDEKS